jgi:hypothetical protein
VGALEAASTGMDGIEAAVECTVVHMCLVGTLLAAVESLELWRLVLNYPSSSS